MFSGFLGDQHAFWKCLRNRFLLVRKASDAVGKPNSVQDMASLSMRYYQFRKGFATPLNRQASVDGKFLP